MQRLLNQAVKALEKVVVEDHRLERWVGQHSQVGDQPFFTVEQFPWAKTLEANWQTIRQELDAILPEVDQLPNYQDISPRQTSITNDDHWKTYFFYAFGYKAQQNCDRCPKTARLLSQIPNLKVAFFSILGPHKQIPEHRGKHKGLIRYHLGLRIPEPYTACGLKVAGQTVHWREGKSLIFDDTFHHAAWNDTATHRVVLFLDIARPLRFPASWVNSAVNALVAASPIIQAAKQNHSQWEADYQQQRQVVAVPSKVQ